WPSRSKRYGPSPRAMNGGVPPTAPNARAGLFTPPGITLRARSKAAALRDRAIGLSGMLAPFCGNPSPRFALRPVPGSGPSLEPYQEYHFSADHPRPTGVLAAVGPRPPACLRLRHVGDDLLRLRDPVGDHPVVFVLVQLDHLPRPHPDLPPLA